MPANDYRRLSSLLKHCTVAIFKTAKGLQGNTEEERWIGSWNIARARLTQLGYMVSGSEVGPATNIKFTNRGAGKSTAHSLEGKRKDGFFNARIPILLKADEPHNPEEPKGKKDKHIIAHKIGKDIVVGSYKEGKEVIRNIDSGQSASGTKHATSSALARTAKVVPKIVKLGGGVRRAKKPFAKKARKARRG